jgi:hypothetical protein
MLAEYTREELAAGLDAVAEEILSAAGVDRPPVDAFRVAAALGIEVALDEDQDGRARCVRRKSYRGASSQLTVMLKPDPRFERQQWALAHEIGEHAAHRVFAAWGIDPREAAPDAREKAACHLAGRLLLPAVWFSADAADCGWDLLALKARYATASHELIARRMLECRPPVIITIFDNRRITFRRGNLPGRVPPPSPAEMACWRKANDRNQSARTRQGTRLLQCWPIHEADWQREILRAEVEECADF